MSLTLYRVSAFPYRGSGGNEAGVVLETKNLTEQEMLTIAKRVNYSETAFLFPSEIADFKLRYFTPTVEVNLCGHATIALFNLMRNLELVEQKPYTIETKEGVLNVIIEEDRVSLQLKKPIFGKEIDKKEIVKALKINKDVLLDYPIQTVSAGINEIFIGVKSIRDLHDLHFNEDDVLALCKKHNALGIYVYTLETKHGYDAHGRNFLSPVGIYEESATGTASGALAAYLQRYLSHEKNEYLFEQGYAMFKPSEIMVSLYIVNDEVDDLYVGGRMRFIDKIIGFMPKDL